MRDFTCTLPGSVLNTAQREKNMNPRVCGVSGPFQGATFSVASEEISMGRDPSNHLSAWGGGRPGDEDTLLVAQSDIEGYYGRLQKARETSRQAVESAQRAELHVSGLRQGPGLSRGRPGRRSKG